MNVDSSSPKPEPLLNTEKAALFLGIQPQTLRVWNSTHRYGLPVVKVGRCVRYRIQDLQAFIESRLSSSSAD